MGADYCCIPGCKFQQRRRMRLRGNTNIPRETLFAVKRPDLGKTEMQKEHRQNITNIVLSMRDTSKGDTIKQMLHKESASICECHFPPEDFCFKKSKKVLRLGAIPILDMPKITYQMKMRIKELKNKERRKLREIAHTLETSKSVKTQTPVRQNCEITTDSTCVQKEFTDCITLPNNALSSDSTVKADLIFALKDRMWQLIENLKEFCVALYSFLPQEFISALNPDFKILTMEVANIKELYYDDRIQHSTLHENNNVFAESRLESKPAVEITHNDDATDEIEPFCTVDNCEIVEDSLVCPITHDDDATVEIEPFSTVDNFETMEECSDIIPISESLVCPVINEDDATVEIEPSSTVDNFETMEECSDIIPINESLVCPVTQDDDATDEIQPSSTVDICETVEGSSNNNEGLVILGNNCPTTPPNEIVEIRENNVIPLKLITGSLKRKLKEERQRLNAPPKMLKLNAPSQNITKIPSNVKKSGSNNLLEGTLRPINTKKQKEKENASTKCVSVDEYYKEMKITHAEWGHAFKCKLCHLVYKKLSQLKLHDQTHTYANRKVCTVCNKIVTHLKTHMLVHVLEPERKFSCGTCGAKFRRRTHKIQHERIFTSCTFPSFKCNICEEKFNKEEEYGNHFKEKHLNKKIICDLCGDEVCEKCVEDKHQVTLLKLYKCKFCDESFTFKKEFSQHIKEKHPYEFSQSWCKCNWCFKYLPNQAELKKHIASHVGNEFLCEYCSDTFNSAKCLKQHITHCALAK